MDRACKDNFDTERIVHNIQQLLMFVNNEMGREVEYDSNYIQPLGNRDNHVAQQVMLYVTDLFSDLGFTTVHANQFEP